MLRIEMLPAAQGDCLWIEYSDKNKPRRILVDGGTSGSIKPLVDKVKSLPAGSRRLELLVVTHVDADHIAGVLKFLETPSLGLEVAEIWFNAYKHLLEKGETFGPAQGEDLSADIVAGKVPWNTKFKGGNSTAAWSWSSSAPRWRSSASSSRSGSRPARMRGSSRASPARGRARRAWKPSGRSTSTCSQTRSSRRTPRRPTAAASSCSCGTRGRLSCSAPTAIRR